MTDFFRPNASGKERLGFDAWAEQTLPEDPRDTFLYASFANTPAATPTDIFTLKGSATKTICVKRIIIGGIAGTAGHLKIALLRRTAANTAGTSSAVTFIKRSTTTPAATAVGTLYTANPSGVGTGAIIRAGRVFLPLVTAVGMGPLVFEGPFYLRGTSEWLAVNGQGDTVPASGVLDFNIEFTEE